MPLDVFVWFLVYFNEKTFQNDSNRSKLQETENIFPVSSLAIFCRFKIWFLSKKKKCHLSFWKRKKIFEKSIQHPIIPNDSRKIVSNGNRNITRQQLMDLIQIWITTKKQKSTPPQIRSLKSKMFYFDMMFDLAQLLLFL